VVHPWLFSLSARLHLGYKHVTGCNPVLHSLSSLSPFPTELQHFDYPLPAVDRSWVRYACSTFLIFPNAETLPVGHKKITEPINAVRRLGDALVHIVHIDRMSSSLSVWFPFHVPVSWLLLLSQLVFHKEQEFLQRFGPAAVARASWLMVAHPLHLSPFSWHLSLGSLFLTPSK